MGNNSLYLHPEYLAPPEQFKEPWTFEFAMVNPNFIGKMYRYVYGVGFPDSYFLGTLMKLDVQTKEFVKVWEDSNCMATEPYFVPRPGSTEEEDGVVLTLCLDPNKQNPTTTLVVLDSHLNELGRFAAPIPTPIGFHSIWIS